MVTPTTVFFELQTLGAKVSLMTLPLSVVVFAGLPVHLLAVFQYFRVSANDRTVLLADVPSQGTFVSALPLMIMIEIGPVAAGWSFQVAPLSSLLPTLPATQAAAAY